MYKLNLKERDEERTPITIKLYSSDIELSNKELI